MIILQIHEAMYGGLDGKDGLLCLTVLNQPVSVGYVRLNSTNPFDNPLLNPNYLAEEGDVDTAATLVLFKFLIDMLRCIGRSIFFLPYLEIL